MSAIVDDRTLNYSIQKPHVSNIQTDDVGRLRAALDAIDAQMKSNQDALPGKADLVAGKVPASQLPAYVDDVLEFANLAAFPVTGESAKIYIALDTGKSYRWTGTVYAVLQNDYTLSPATAVTLGGVKAGAGLGVAPDGELYVVGGADGTTAVGFRTIPQNSQSAGYTCTLDDSGKHILHPSADTTARTFTIPANISVAYPIGTAITFVNQASAGVVTISITTDTMRLARAGTTGSRTLAANGVATAIKLTATEWIVSGSGLT